MTRLTASQIDESSDRAPMSVRRLRADCRLWLRGALLIQKLWRVRYNHDRHETPLPALRGKR